MKNVDVPMWDKGDSTDSYSKGGGSMFSDFESLSDKIPMIEEVYEKVLGRKPSSREISLYKYSVLKREEIINKLLNSEEHKEIVEKGRTYPELEERERLAMSNILKLKHGIDDMKKEHDELKNILNEKNKIIESLREEKTAPYINGELPTDRYNTYYNTAEGVSAENSVLKKESFLDKLYKFLKSLSN